MRLTIVGAGMAGLLAANMLRRRGPSILEAQSSLPNNHHAVLRFRTEEVSRQLRIPFRKVRVFKSCDEADPIRAAMLYSRKVTGRYELRSLIDLTPVERFIAPTDLVERMADGFNPSFDRFWRPSQRREGEATIWTGPMSALMDLLKWEGPRPTFLSAPGWTLTAEVADCDVFATRYYAKHHGPVYRASITGNQLIIEGAGAPPGADFDPVLTVRRVLMDFGITGEHGAPDLHVSRYAKIGKLSTEEQRHARDFMFWATHHFNVYSLGRFATWRAGLLLDDLVNDIIQIESWINSGSYELRKAI